MSFSIIQKARSHLGWTEEAEEAHIGRVSAGSAAGILGWCKYSSPYERFMSITGQSRVELNGAMELGLRSEEMCNEWLKDLMWSGMPIYGEQPVLNEADGEPWLIHPEHRWLMATPDARIWPHPSQDEGTSWFLDRDPGLKPSWNVQYKTHRFMPKEYGDEIRRKSNPTLMYPTSQIPADKLAQVLVEQACMNSDCGSLLFIICLTDAVPRAITVPRMPAMEAELISCLESFYDLHVSPNRAPSEDHAGFASPALGQMLADVQSELRVYLP